MWETSGGASRSYLCYPAPAVAYIGGLLHFSDFYTFQDTMAGQVQDVYFQYEKRRQENTRE